MCSPKSNRNVDGHGFSENNVQQQWPNGGAFLFYCIYFNFQGLSPGNVNKVSSFYRAHLPAIGDFASNTFDEFNEMDQDEKVRPQ